jgi:putative acetyltransferase
MDIREDDLRGPEIAELLVAHLHHTTSSSPPESMHALDLDALRAPDITFWSVWDGPTLVGCGALKELDATHGEVKSMHTAASFRGRGVGAAMLKHIIAASKARGYRRLSLETGSMDAFAPARLLYSRFGFAPCGPFSSYRPDPNSVFMTIDLSA